MSGEEEIGTLIVVVLKAQNLHDKHFFKQDVYAKVSFNGVTKQTKTDLKGGQHPVWDEEIRFPVYKNTATKFRQLEASCWAKEHKDDTFLGESKVDMTPTIKSEWVPLTTNDVQRGDIYLEITYYSNGPAPIQSSLLAAPANLARRPSKMSQADRMHRPISSSATYSAAQQQLGPPTPPKSKLSPPPESLRPAAVPGALKPGPARISPKQQQQPLPASSQQQQQQGAPSRLQNAAPAPVPAILRPGNPQSDPRPAQSHSRQSSASPPQRYGAPSGPAAPYSSSSYTHSGPILYASGTPIPPATGSGYPHNGAVPYASSTPVPPSESAYVHNGPIPYTASTPVPPANSTHNPNPYSSPPPNQPYTHRAPSNPSVANELWNTTPPPGGPISFPVPNFPAGPPAGAEPPAKNYNSSFYTPPYQSTPPPTHPHRTSSYPHQPIRTSSSSSDLPDPYLIARYQSPLPLPPGAEAQPHRRRSSAGADTEAAPARPSPSPPSTFSALPSGPSASGPSLPSLIPPRSDPPRSKTPIDESRLRALRQAEEEAARRKEQEERDMELARQLDQEELEREERERAERRRREAERAAAPAHASPPVPSRKSLSPPPYARAEAERRTQEEKDMELARQLDRELNIGGSD